MFSFPNFTFVDQARISYHLLSWVGPRAILDALENIKIGAFAGSQNVILGVKLLFIKDKLIYNKHIYNLKKLRNFCESEIFCTLMNLKIKIIDTD